MIRFEQVGKRYPGGQQALSDLSFEIKSDELVFLTGHSGAGKSTLLKLIALLERPSHGSIHFDGMPLAQVSRRGIPFLRRRIGIIVQDHRLLDDRSVFDNLALPLIIAGARRAEIGKRIRAALDKVGLLAREGDLPKELSAGEQQRVGIARAIVARPPVVLADEPTGNLDPELSNEIMGLFTDLNEVGMCLVIASHDLHLVRRMGRRVLVLENGSLIDDFRPEEHHGRPA
jgi:cell division transport system ATP-binding protein